MNTLFDLWFRARCWWMKRRTMRWNEYFFEGQVWARRVAESEDHARQLLALAEAQLEFHGTTPPDPFEVGAYCELQTIVRAYEAQRS